MNQTNLNRITLVALYGSDSLMIWFRVICVELLQVSHCMFLHADSKDNSAENNLLSLFLSTMFFFYYIAYNTIRKNTHSLIRILNTI